MTGFAQDIAPLFRDKDRSAMSSMFDLADYDDVREHAADILESVDSGSMPCDNPWPAEQTAAFRRWIEEGYPA